MVFEKYHGSGNDFIIVDNRLKEYDNLSDQQIVMLCHRRFGIGSDGLMLIQHSDVADFEMIFFNPDGSKSLCGNGSRCAVAFASRIGLAGEIGTFVTTDGLHSYKVLSDKEVAVSMHDVGLPTEVEGHQFLNTGSPHLIVETGNVDDVDVSKAGNELRNSRYFKDKGGTNVNFVSPMVPNTFAVRTYERGVEAETLSCGTGVTAVALTMAAQGSASSPVEIHTHGGLLSVRFKRIEGGFENIWLQGPVHHVFSGRIDA